MKKYKPTKFEIENMRLKIRKQHRDSQKHSPIVNVTSTIITFWMFGWFWWLLGK